MPQGLRLPRTPVGTPNGSGVVVDPPVGTRGSEGEGTNRSFLISPILSRIFTTRKIDNPTPGGAQRPP